VKYSVIFSSLFFLCLASSGRSQEKLDSAAERVIENSVDVPGGTAEDPDQAFEYVENLSSRSSISDIHSRPEYSWIAARRHSGLSVEGPGPKFTLRSRGGFPVDASLQRGAVDDDYVGSAASIYNRISARLPYVAVAFLEQKKSWEGNLTDRLNGYATLSDPIVLASSISVDRVIVGDYALSFGNGLLFGGGSHASQTRTPTLVLEERAFGARGTLSSSPYRSFRGATVSLFTGPVYSTFFASSRSIDASIVNDTINTIYTDPHYRTLNEVATKHNSNLKTFGLRTQVANADTASLHLAAGFTGYSMSYDLPYNGTSGSSFIGRSVSAASLDALVIGEKFSVSAEGALSVNDTNRKNAYLAAARFEPTNAVAFGLSYRYIPFGFVSPFGSIAGSEITSIANANGLYAAVEVAPIYRVLRVTGYTSLDNGLAPVTDLFVKKKSDNLIAAFVTPFQKFEGSVVVRMRSDEHTTTASNFFSTTQEDRTNIRLEARYDNVEAFATRARFEWTRYADDVSSREQGWLAWQETEFRLAAIDTRLTVSAGRFETDGFNSAIYLYEAGVPGTGSTAILEGKGWQFGARAIAAVASSLHVSASVYGRYFDEARVIGSDLTARVGRSDFQALAQLELRL
jgi:hypothetical protein